MSPGQCSDKLPEPSMLSERKEKESEVSNSLTGETLQERAVLSEEGCVLGALKER